MITDKAQIEMELKRLMIADEFGNSAPTPIEQKAKIQLHSNDELAKGHSNMPIQKDRSKDIPGKNGYSVRDIEKLTAVIKDYVPEDETPPNNKDGCFKHAADFTLAVLVIVMLLKGWF